MQKLAEAGHNQLLTGTGRTTGRPRSTPVRPARYGGQRWLAALFLASAVAGSAEAISLTPAGLASPRWRYRQR